MRRNKQILLTIILTLSLTGLAWIGGSRQSQIKMLDRVVAKNVIPAGTQMTADCLSLVQLPASDLSDCYLTEISQAIGQWTAVPLQPGELISSKILSQSASGLQYPDSGPGRRLLTISLNPADANGYWLAAGNLVDLYLIPRNRENGLEPQMLEKIRIMAVLNNNQENEEGIKMASSSEPLLCLDLNMEQARLLGAAPGLFDIRLAVINEPLALSTN